MKAIYLGIDEITADILERLTSVHFSRDYKLVFVKDVPTLIERLINEELVALIYIDVDHKDVDPNKVMELITDSVGERATIFCGNSNMINSRLLSPTYDHDYCWLLPKPIIPEEFVLVVRKATLWIKDEEFGENLLVAYDAQFIPIRPRMFFDKQKVPYDIYINVIENKYQKVVSKNKSFYEGDIQRLIRKGVREFLMYKEEQIAYLENSLQTIVTDLQKRQVDPFQTLCLQVHTMLHVHQFLRLAGVTALIEQITASFMETIIWVRERGLTLRQVIDIFPFNERDVAEKSVFLCYVLMVLVDKMGWTSNTTRSKFLLAAIMHDCYLDDDQFIRSSVFDRESLKTIKDIKKKEMFLQHPIKAATLTQSFSGFLEVDFLVREHHEMPNGTGFPSRANAMKMTQVSAAFNLSVRFVERFIQDDPMTNAAARRILLDYSGFYDSGSYREGLKKLMEVFKKD